MTARRRIVFSILILVCLILTIQQLRKLAPPGPQTERPNNPVASKADQERSATPEATPIQSPGIDQTANHPGAAIADETIATFKSAAALDAFLEAAKRNGLAILSHNRALLAARVATPDEIARRMLDGLAGPETEFEENFTVLIPFPTEAFPGEAGASFENRALDFMGAPSDRDQFGVGLTIAVLDTGILPHPSLEGVSIRSIDLIDDGSEPSPHGTAVASLIAGGSGTGIAPSSELLSIRVLDADGIGDTFTLAQGIVEAVDAGARIVNMSLGGFGTNSTLSNAIDYAQSKGVVLVSASGNEGIKALPYPAQYDSVIAVSAINADGRHAPFSNQAATVDIAAPGVGVYAAWSEDDWVSLNGTSVSAPYVSGAIAAIASQDEKLDPLSAAQLLLETANDTGFPGPDSQTGQGIVNLERALEPKTSRRADLAIADIHLATDPSNPELSSLYLTAENRGTETAQTVSIDVTHANGITQPIYFGRLAPGEIAYHQIDLATSTLYSKGYYIEASISKRAAAKDENPSNDAKSLRILPQD